MAGRNYGWQDHAGGVEPGFADTSALRFGSGRDSPDDAETTPYGASGASGEARDDAWLQQLLE